LVLSANEVTLELLDVVLIADSSDEPNFLIRESFSALFKHVGVADVETIEDTVCVNPQDFFLCLVGHGNK